MDNLLGAETAGNPTQLKIIMTSSVQFECSVRQNLEAACEHFVRNLKCSVIIIIVSLVYNRFSSRTVAVVFINTARTTLSAATVAPDSLELLQFYLSNPPPPSPTRPHPSAPPCAFTGTFSCHARSTPWKRLHGHTRVFLTAEALVFLCVPVHREQRGKTRHRWGGVGGAGVFLELKSSQIYLAPR